MRYVVNKNALFGNIPDSALSLFSVDFYNIYCFPFGFCMLNRMPCAATFFAVPDGKHNVGMVYHIIVTHEHKMQCGRQADALTKEDLCRIPAHEECIAIAH